jgi:hypothetical protein
MGCCESKEQKVLPHHNRDRTAQLANADDQEDDVEELDERIQKLRHKLENARGDFARAPRLTPFSPPRDVRARAGL